MNHEKIIKSNKKLPFIESILSLLAFSLVIMTTVILITTSKRLINNSTEVIAFGAIATTYGIASLIFYIFLLASSRNKNVSTSQEKKCSLSKADSISSSNTTPKKQTYDSLTANHNISDEIKEQNIKEQNSKIKNKNIAIVSTLTIISLGIIYTGIIILFSAKKMKSILKTISNALNLNISNYVTTNLTYYSIIGVTVAIIVTSLIMSVPTIIKALCKNTEKKQDDDDKKTGSVVEKKQDDDKKTNRTTESYHPDEILIIDNTNNINPKAQDKS